MAGEERGGLETPGQPRQPTPAPSPPAGVLSGGRLEGEAVACPLSCPDLKEGRQLDPGGLFFWIQDYRARVPLPPPDGHSEIRHFSFARKRVLLGSEQQSRKALGWGRHSSTAQAVKAPGDSPPFLLLLSRRAPHPFSKARILESVPAFA